MLGHIVGQLLLKAGLKLLELLGRGTGPPIFGSSEGSDAARVAALTSWKSKHSSTKTPKIKIKSKIVFVPGGSVRAIGMYRQLTVAAQGEASHGLRRAVIFWPVILPKGTC